jgi:hypothetical protein
MRSILPLLSLSLISCASNHPVPNGTAEGLPAVHSLGAAEASLVLGMHDQPMVRVMSDGRALVTDRRSRTLVMTGAALTSLDTLFDATTPAPLTYPLGFTHLVAARGDSTLFFDVNARGYRLIDPSGRVVRRLSVPENAVLRSLQSPSARVALDAGGRLVLEAQRSMFDRPVTGIQPQAESLMLARVSFDAPGWDSLGAVMGSGQRLVISNDTTLRPRPATAIIPLVAVGDAWTMTSGGAIAVVRSGDFHVDWIASDGTQRSSPPVPWPWRNFTQAERDSLRSAARPTMGIRSVVVGGSGGARPAPPPITTAFDTLPTRVPAFGPVAVGDRDGRVWLLLGARMFGPPAGTPATYAVLDATGRVVDRIELPARRVVVGFDRTGAVYAVAPSMTPDGYVIERYRYRAR